MEKIDCLGFACPVPVVKAKKALKNSDVVSILVDNEVSTQNLSKMAAQLGFEYKVEKLAPETYEVIIDKGDSTAYVDENTEIEGLIDPTGKSSDSYIVVIEGNEMGKGDAELGTTLIKSFLYALTEQDVLPSKILLYNSGVKLVAEGSSALEDLQALQDQGVEIASCGICVNYYGLDGKVAIGSISNMYAIIEEMRSSPRIVKP